MFLVFLGRACLWLLLLLLFYGGSDGKSTDEKWGLNGMNMELNECDTQINGWVENATVFHIRHNSLSLFSPISRAT